MEEEIIDYYKCDFASAPENTRNRLEMKIICNLDNGSLHKKQYCNPNCLKLRDYEKEDYTKRLREEIKKEGIIFLGEID